METTRGASIELWLGLGLAFGLLLLALVGAALVGRLPWAVPLAAWLLGNALIPFATLCRRHAPAVAHGMAGD